MSEVTNMTPTKPSGEKPSFQSNRGGRKTVDTSHSNESSDDETQQTASLELQALKKKIREKEQQKREDKGAAIKGTDEEHQASIKLQSMQRVKLAKKKVEEVKQEKRQQRDTDNVAAIKGTDEEHQASIKLQSIQRGKLAKKKVEEASKKTAT
jgi:hypothetical protein